MTDFLNAFAPWSLSKSDLAAKCPFAFKLRYLDKVPRKEGKEAKIGTAAHRVQELILRGEDPRHALEAALTEMPQLLEEERAVVEDLLPAYTAFYERMLRFKDRYPIKAEYFEQEWAVNRAFEAVPYDSPDAFFRGIVDYALHVEQGYLVVIDHKSGKRKPVSNYANQLDCYAVLGLATFPELTGVHAALHYMKAKELDWHVLRRADEIRKMLKSYTRHLLTERAERLEGYNPKPGPLCKWCDYLQSCPAGNEHLVSAKSLKRSKKTSR